MPADNAEAQKLGVAGTTLKPADIVAAANDIATNKENSEFYAMYHSFMEDNVFMKVNWGDGQQYDVRDRSGSTTTTLREGPGKPVSRGSSWIC